MASVLVQIKAESSQYQQAMRQAAAEMKKLTAEHSLASAQAKLNGSAQDGLKAKVTELTSKMTLQKDTVSKSEKQYENLKRQLELQKTEHENLKTKLDATKKAYEESAAATGKDSEETKALEKECGELNSKLAVSEKNIQKTETAITNQETAVLKGKAALAEMEQELKDVNAELARAPFDEYAQKAEKVGGTLTNAGKKLMPLTTGILAVGTAAVKTTADFDSEMSKVAAISGATGEDIDSLRDKAREMGSKTKFSASEAAQGMQYMAMAGWKTQDMMDGLEGIMNLAAASGEDLATTSDIVTDALTAFGLSAKDSSHFSDILAAASSNANTNVSMMGETFKYAAPVLGSLGYSAEDAALAIGLMANAGIKSSQAGTALRGAITNLAKPTDTVAAAMDKYGISLTDSEGNMLSLREVMEQLREKLGGLSEAEQANAAASLFGKEAMSGMLAIINGSDADFDKLSNAIANCDGTSEKMAETMNDNLKGQITILISQLQELAISFGEILMPTIRDIVTHIQNFVDKLNQMDEGQKENIVRIGLLVAAVAPLLITLGKAITFTANVSRSLGTLAEGFTKVGGFSGIAQKGVGLFTKALGFITSPAGIAVAAIAGIAAVIMTLWKNNEGFRNAVTEIWNGIKTAFENFTQGITERLNALGFDFNNFTEVVSAVWNEFCNLLAPVIEAAFSVIATKIETAFNVILGIWDTFSALLSGDWSGAWENMKGVVSTVFDGIKKNISTVLTAIQKVADVFLGWFGTNWETVWNDVKAFFEEIWNGISTFFTTIWNEIVKTVTTFCTTVKTTVSTIFNAVKDVVTTVWDTIKNVIQVAIMFIVEIITAAFELITVPFRFIWENCKDTIIEVWEAIKSTVSTAVNTVKSTVTSVFNSVKATVTTIWNGIKTTTTTVWNGVKTVVTTVVNAVKTVVTSVFNSVKTTVTTIWNGIKTTTTTVWNGIKTAVSTPINAAKTAVSTAVNSVRSSVSSAWNTVKSTTTSTWNRIKSAITTPINAAKTAVGNAIEAIKSKFNFSWSLPHLSLPHISISGGFSINPPSVPHFSIQWYKDGAIMTKPTVFGAIGNRLLAGGEAGEEAILPLKLFFDKVGEMLDKKLEAVSGGTTVYVYVTMDGELIATKVYSKVEDKMIDEVEKRR